MVGRYAWDKWESWLIGQESGYDEVSTYSIQQQLKRDPILTATAIARRTCTGANDRPILNRTLNGSIRLVPSFLS